MLDLGGHPNPADTLARLSRKAPRYTGDARRSRFERCADSSQVEEHSLRPIRRSTLDGHKTILLVPTGSFPIRIGDDAAATNFIGDAQADPEGFGNQRVAQSSANKVTIHGESRQ
jgi:hypothetical protein